MQRSRPVQLLRGGRLELGQTCVFLRCACTQAIGTSMGSCDLLFLRLIKINKNSLQAQLPTTYTTWREERPSLKYQVLQKHTWKEYLVFHVFWWGGGKGRGLSFCHCSCFNIFTYWFLYTLYSEGFKVSCFPILRLTPILVISNI